MMNKSELKAWLQGYLEDKLDEKSINKIIDKIDTVFPSVDFVPVEPLYPHPWYSTSGLETGDFWAVTDNGMKQIDEEYMTTIMETKL